MAVFTHVHVIIIFIIFIQTSPTASRSSVTFKMDSITSNHEFSATAFGTTNEASAKACTPILATSNVLIPGTTALSSIAFVTARSLSQTASLIRTVTKVQNSVVSCCILLNNKKANKVTFYREGMNGKILVIISTIFSDLYKKIEIIHC